MNAGGEEENQESQLASEGLIWVMETGEQEVDL